MTRRLTVVAASLFMLAADSHAQLQSPDAFLGYELGSRFTPHYRVVDYVRHVAEQSPIVEVVQYGETNEHRPLLVAIVSDRIPAGTLEDARLGNLALVEGTDALAGDEGDAPAIVWLSYNVHGNESSSTEASMKVLHELADPSNPKSKEWLKNTIVIIDPCINPDGRDRYVNWYNRVVGSTPTADADDWSHDEPWPGGRTNHYLFDLNRDWAWATQKETRARLNVYREWMPHVHVDFHEQGVNQPYYFAPAARPYHEDITAWQAELQDIIGRNNARHFDANNWLYFTREVFDLFYPAYGDSWPTYNGAVGMTYEQAGSGRAGLAIVTAESDTLSLLDRLTHHYTSSVSTIEAVSTNRSRIVREFRDYFRSAVDTPPGVYKAWVLDRSGNPDAAADLADLLDRQGIQYGIASDDQTVRGFRYADATTGNYEVKRGDLVIPARQPKSRLAKILFEPRSALQDSVTYDITGWAQPYAFGIAGVASRDVVPAILQAASTDETSNESAAQAEPGDDPYAWILEWQSARDQKLVAALLRRGVNVRMASRPFKADSRTFAPGTVVITRAGNNRLGDRLGGIVRDEADHFQQPVFELASGLVDGGSDLGSGTFTFMEAPNVAVVIGEPVSSYASGEVWHFFDETLRYPVTLLPADNVRRTDLSAFDVLVLPDGNYGSILPDEALERLVEWMRNGGRLVAIERAVSFLSGKPGFNVKARPRQSDTTAVTPDSDNWIDRDRKAVSNDIPGSIYKVAIDPTHPIGYGLGSTYFALKRSVTGYDPLDGDKGWNVGVLGDGRPVSGFSGYRTVEPLRGSAVIMAQEIGRGGVVYLADDPLYRGFWRAGGQLFGNAIFAR
ncbi:MAG: M14 family zinc carboxypeptidase [Rhodothermales bacterium]